jgi:3-oxoadipate enol-lactonase
MKLNYRLDGPAGAPTLVLASALGTTHELWEPQLSALTGFRVLRYDHRGHGGSDVVPGPVTIEDLAGDVVELLDELELESVSFCGISIGGAVGMAFAAANPERVDRLVLACTSVRFGPPEGWYERAGVVREEGLDGIADELLGRWFTPGFRAAQPETVARFRAMLVATPREGYAACCDALARWDFRGELHRITAPTLVIAAAEDPSTPPAHGETIAAGTGGELVVLEQAAHAANVEQPDAFSRALLRHLEQAVAA